MAIANGEVVQAAGLPEVWLIENMHRRWIPDVPTLLATWSWAAVRVLPLTEVFALPRGPDYSSAMRINSGRYGWGVFSNRWNIPGWFGAEDQGSGIAIADINGSGRPDYVMFHIDNPTGENHGYYRVGFDVSVGGMPTQWSQPKAVPEWFGAEDQGAGIAIGDISGNGRPDLVVYHIDNPGGENHGYYRIGWDLTPQGDVTNWSPVKTIPGWFGAQDQGGDIALMDYNRSGRLDLVVAHLDNPGGENHAYYRIGWDLDAGGNPTGGWSPVKPIPGWFGSENQGLGITGFNYFGNRCLAVGHVDNPVGSNRVYVRVAALDNRGNNIAGWSQPVWSNTPDGHGWETAGLGIAAGFITGRNQVDLVTCYLDDAAGENGAYWFLSEMLLGVP